MSYPLPVLHEGEGADLPAIIPPGPNAENGMVPGAWRVHKEYNFEKELKAFFEVDCQVL